MYAAHWKGRDFASINICDYTSIGIITYKNVQI